MVRRADNQASAGRAVASWQRGAVHLWGWDGVQTMAPLWLHGSFRARGWPGPPSSFGFHSSLDVTAPNGERLRPMSVRLDAVAGLGWLRAVTTAADDPVRWFGRLADLAGTVVDAGAVVVAIDGAEPAAVSPAMRWECTVDCDDALDSLAAAMPAICLPDVPATDLAGRRREIGAVFAAFVDGAARAALQAAGWTPDVPRDRSASTAVTRAVFTALVGQNRRVDTTRPAHADLLPAVGEALRRRRLRSRGEPVLVRRVRLTVPDDRLEPWVVGLELVDEADPGRWCSADDVWGRTPLAVEVAGAADNLPLLEAEVLALAELVADAVPVVAALADTPQPSQIELEVDDEESGFEDIEQFLEVAPAALERAAVVLVGPELLVRSDVAVRGRATQSPGSDRRAGLDRQTIVKWSFTAHDGGDAERGAITEAEIARAEATGSSLLHTGHRWVRIDPAALRKAKARRDEYLRRVEELEAAAGPTTAGANPLALLQLAADAAEAGDSLGSDPFEGLDTEPSDEDRSEAWSGLLLGGLPDSSLREEVEPPSFRGELRHYQRRGLSWLRFLERLGLGGCLADDMGLGKTATTLAHLAVRPGPHLVICPLSVVHNWETEATRFTPSLSIVVHHGAGRDGELDAALLGEQTVVVTTYGLAGRDVDALAAVEWSAVVADEAQFVKNPNTRAARALRKLPAGQRIALTGTPVENRLSELWAILDWVNPGMLGSREKFRHRYAKPIERGDDEARASEAAAALRSLTQPFVLRRSKADRDLVPELPDKIEQTAFAGLTREQALLYQKVVDQLLEDASLHEAAPGRPTSNQHSMKRRSIVLAALTKLKQICNHPAHALGDGSRLTGRSGKLARFDELVDELVEIDERALVFTQFVEMGKLLQRHLGERRDWPVPFLHGALAKGRRDRLVATFQDGEGPPLLLVSLKAGGTGLNLTAASQVIHYDRWWNPAVENQATDRAWRIGQGRTVVVHKLVCEGTVEERIAAMIDDKQALADMVVGSGETWLSELSTSDLHDLVRLDSGRDDLE